MALPTLRIIGFIIGIFLITLAIAMVVPMGTLVVFDRTGDLPSFLHATEAGRPVYARMGYTPVSTHTAFMDKRLLGDH